jgi:hypothetical protein
MFEIVMVSKVKAFLSFESDSLSKYAKYEPVFSCGSSTSVEYSKKSFLLVRE